LNAGDTRDQNETLTFQLKNQTLEPGQNTRIDFRAKDFRGIEGYQFALQFNPEILEFVDVIPGDLAALSTDNFGFSRLNDGILTTSWNGTTAAALPDDAILFSIDLLAKQKIELNKVLWLNTNMMQAEAYNENVSRLNLALDFIGELASSAGFSLAQNQPNPFRQETMIRFELPAASTATLSIYDMSGRQLHVVSGEFAQGWNELTIEKEALSATGVLYYQLDTPNDSATKKMILLK
ncbi:MAG: T9SS type A sorting domain-containing protein, partial [Bacteroidota bacterium]